MSTVPMKMSRPYKGMPLLKQGFRLFFLGASVWAIVSMLAWTSVFIFPFQPRFALPILAWHQHELLFGYAGAAVAGFLLTASANWASRPTLSGAGLLGMFGLWLVSRLVLLQPFGLVPPVALVALVMSFPIVLIAFVACELIKSGSTRNLRVLFIVGIHAVANAVFLYEVFLGVVPRVGARLGIASLVMLLMLIGGRVVPAFTRTWLAKGSSNSRPAEFSHFDAFTIVFSSVTLLVWVASPDSTLLAVALLISGVFNTIRFLRWQGHRTLNEPLVLILHIAYAFIALGFLLAGLAMLKPSWAPGSAAVHVWTTGAISLMCLAVMTRASLGHMGQPLKADGLIVSIYALLLVCLFARVAASYGLAYQLTLGLSALTWCAAHAVFIARYGRSFLTRR